MLLYVAVTPLYPHVQKSNDKIGHGSLRCASGAEPNSITSKMVEKD